MTEDTKIIKPKQRFAPVAPIYEFFPRVNSFLLFISLRWGCVIIGILSIMFCVWHQKLLGKRDYEQSKNKNSIKSLWKTLFLLSDIALAVLGGLLIIGAIWRIRHVAPLWILGALQNAILLLIFEYIASPLHYKKIISEEAFEAWPYTLYYCAIPFVELYCIYVVNSFFIVCPVKPKKPPVCSIPMTDFK